MSRLRRRQDRDDFLAAHLLVRVCVARLLSVAPEDVSIVQRCPTCGGPHGRPEVAGHPGVGASLAHSRGVVAAAAGTVAVGVDVEAVPPAGDPTAGDLTASDLSVALTAAEIAAIEASADPSRALRLVWVRKEACLKAGLVDLDGLRGFDLSTLPLDPAAGELMLRVAPFGGWAVHDWWDPRSGAVGVVAAPAGTEVTLAGP
ncbi:MAG TPA: 4'-phosphopantetheinyl transferase superfamily protein [Acidimicrobiia bacterium]|nr:4'-phosphopantetheinyl transferase superfamily protein [Acidimicrobiia bacterium]